MTQAANQLDVVYGEYSDLTQVREFVSGIKTANCSGTLYIGYPVLFIDDGKIEFDALLVSPNRGIIIFDLYSAGEAPKHKAGNISVISTTRQEQLYAALFNRLNSFKELRKGRSLVVDIATVTINPVADDIKKENEFNEFSIELLSDFYESIADADLTSDQEQHLNAAIQRISNLKPQKKRLNITRADSRGAVIKRIEEQIANLDLWQKRGSIEYVNGPQRIRGLAGSGKTVVLALKAAYLHVKRPDWDIAITFNSRALYQQFESLLTRFVYSQVNDEPDWTKLHILHSWGDSSRPGIYSKIVHNIGSTYRDFSSASRKWSYSTAFSGACQEALDAMGDKELDLFDMVLIDEAQDLPTPFFRLVYNITKAPKRIIWAYDDLQSLGDTQLPSPKDLFGVDAGGNSLVVLKNKDDYPQEDIVLPRCYRTPPESLVIAHGLGFGIYREPVVQMFPQPKIWERLGYQVKSGSLEFSEHVELIRDPESVPDFFGRLLKQDEVIQFKKFEDASSQYEWVAHEIKRLIEEEDLQCSDFLIVIPDTYKSKSISARMLIALQNVSLVGRIPGVNSSRDSLFAEDMISITHIYRAKGNEAPVVFVIDADYCNKGIELKQKRNILFTAITRSRAWAYVCGITSAFDGIMAEYENIVDNNYSLSFEYPTEEQIPQLSSAADAQSLVPDESDAFMKVRSVLDEVRQMPWEQIPFDIQEILKTMGPE